MNAVAQIRTEAIVSPRPCLLVIDDDAAWRSVVGRALGARGYDVLAAESAADGLQLARGHSLAGAIVDLRLPDQSGLHAVSKLRALLPMLPIVVLTGYASIATAVEAVKLGATHYLAKPVEIDAILQALGRKAGDAQVAVPVQPLSVERLEWEYIQHVLLEHDGNLSATARCLGMHRRTLQRKLAKRPPRR
jgi:two-component system response regulator RegA